MNDRAAGGKGIGGRTCRSGENEAIGAVAADEIAVDGEFEFDHAGEGAFVDDGVVENVLAVDGGARADEFDLEHDALAHGRAAGEGFLEGGVEFLDGEASKETQAAHVDGENGNAARGSNARRGEESAIPAEDKENFRLIGKFIAGERLGGFGESGGGFLVKNYAQTACFKPLKEVWDDGGKIGAARSRDDADRIEKRSGRHDCLGFYFRTPLRAWRKYS